MTTIQFGRDDFAAFSLATARETREAVRANILPQLTRLSVDLRAPLSSLAGRELLAHVAVRGDRTRPVQEAFVAFGRAPKDYRSRPHFAFAVSRAGVHARVALASEASTERTRVASAIERDIVGLTKRFRSLAGLRAYGGSNPAGPSTNGSLPAEVIMDESFWVGLVSALRTITGELDLGFGWPASRARTLALIEILTAFERLAPIYRLMEAKP